MDTQKEAEELADKFSNPTDGVLWPVQRNELREAVAQALTAAHAAGRKEGLTDSDQQFKTYEAGRKAGIREALKAVAGRGQARSGIGALFDSGWNTANKHTLDAISALLDA